MVERRSGVQTDVLQILKNHGVNLVRVRPSSAPPYSDSSQTGCTGNACFAETDTQDLDLAKRTKNLGMSLELTLLFDGGGSSSVPPAWTGQTLAQLQTDVYNYVKAEIMSYRQAGTIPDLVSIGNEVDTGFLGPTGSPTGSGTGFTGFTALQIQAMQAVADAASDTSIGPAIPAPLTCIHITPAWNLTQFFTLANQNDIPYDAICQSYYPFFHGPLTDAQAAQPIPATNPSSRTCSWLPPTASANPSSSSRRRSTTKMDSTPMIPGTARPTTIDAGAISDGSSDRAAEPAQQLRNGYRILGSPRA